MDPASISDPEIIRWDNLYESEDIKGSDGS
jgi:hypothetical protein